MRTPDGAVHEQVIVHEGDGNLAEMTRAAALDFYAERRDVPAKANDGGATKPLPKTLDATANDTAAPPPAAASPTPLLEIRETCDAAGAIVSSEVVNITNTVRRQRRPRPTRRPTPHTRRRPSVTRSTRRCARGWTSWRSWRRRRRGAGARASTARGACRARAGRRAS